MTGGHGVIVEGARGAGLALARGLTDLGLRLIVTDTEATVAEAAAAGIGQTGMACDPGDGGSVGRLAYAAADALDQVDLVVLVLNHTGPARSSLAVPAADFDSHLTGRSRPLFHVARHFAPAMQARGRGGFLTLATLPAGPDPWADAAAGWIAAATRALAAEWAPLGLRVNAVIAARDDSPVLPRFMAARAPVARPPVALGVSPLPQDIADAALAFCGEGARSITGQVLRLDGGRAL